jgi:hypothetical protein
MPESRDVEFAVLNIAADPHDDPDVYRSLLTKVAHVPKRFWGDEFGAITAPEQYEPGLSLGTIHVWQELDPDKPAINKETLQEIRVEDSGINVPENLGLNTKHYFYVFRHRNHKLFYEKKTDDGFTLAPSRLKKILDILFAPINLAGEMNVAVTVVPDEDGLEKVLAIPRISKLSIHIEPPNADANDKAAERVLKRLADQGAKSQDIMWVAKSRKKGLKPNADTLSDAEVAADNGVVTSSGYDESGRRVAPRSTEEYPKIIPYVIEGAGSALTGLIVAARNTVIRVRRRIQRD